MLPTSDLDSLLVDAIDMHVHVGPDPVMATRLDSVGAAKQASTARMRAIVLKNHSGSTALAAATINHTTPEVVVVVGSVCLDNEVGGLNPHAVEAAASLGARVVWLPTIDSSNSRIARSSRRMPINETNGLSILDERGKLVPEVELVLQLVKQYDMVICTGHISPRETHVLVDRALDLGIRKILITHPLEKGIVHEAHTIGSLRELAEKGVFVELTCVGLLPTQASVKPEDLVDLIRIVGADHCILSSDLGMYHNPTPVEGLRLLMAVLLTRGITEEEIRRMIKTNPAQLLDL